MYHPLHVRLTRKNLNFDYLNQPPQIPAWLDTRSSRHSPYAPPPVGAASSTHWLDGTPLSSRRKPPSQVPNNPNPSDVVGTVISPARSGSIHNNRSQPEGPSEHISANQPLVHLPRPSTDTDTATQGPPNTAATSVRSALLRINLPLSHGKQRTDSEDRSPEKSIGDLNHTSRNMNRSSPATTMSASAAPASRTSPRLSSDARNMSQSPYTAAQSSARLSAQCASGETAVHSSRTSKQTAVMYTHSPSNHSLLRQNIDTNEQNLPTVPPVQSGSNTPMSSDIDKQRNELLNQPSRDVTDEPKQTNISPANGAPTVDAPEERQIPVAQEQNLHRVDRVLNPTPKDSSPACPPSHPDRGNIDNTIGSESETPSSNAPAIQPDPNVSHNALQPLPLSTTNNPPINQPPLVGPSSELASLNSASLSRQPASPNGLHPTTGLKRKILPGPSSQSTTGALHSALKRPRSLINAVEAGGDVMTTNDNSESNSWAAAVNSGTSQQTAAATAVDGLDESEKKVQEYVVSYGLLIVERDRSSRVTWLCCKLCPIFGCKSRKTISISWLMDFRFSRLSLRHI